MQPPTDNLYKFMAISGLMCFVFFFFDFNKRLDDLNSTVEMLEMQQVEFHARKDALSDSVEYFTKKISILKEQILSQEDAISTVKAIDAFQDDLQGKNEALTVVNAKLNKAIDQAAKKLEDIKALSVLYSFLEFISLAVAALGVVLWYFMTQKHQDKKDRGSV